MPRQSIHFRIVATTLLGILGGILIAFDCQADSVIVSDAVAVSQRLRGGLQDPIGTAEEAGQDELIEYEDAEPCYKTDLNNQINCTREGGELKCEEFACDEFALDCNATGDADKTGYDAEFLPDPYVPSSCLTGESVGGMKCLKLKHTCDQRIKCKTGANSCDMTINGAICKATSPKQYVKTKVDAYVQSSVFCDLVGF